MSQQQHPPFTCWVEFSNKKDKLTFENTANYNRLIPVIRGSKQLSVGYGSIDLFSDAAKTIQLDVETPVDRNLQRIYVATTQPQQVVPTAELVLSWLIRRYGNPREPPPFTSHSLPLEGRDNELNKIIGNVLTRIAFLGDGNKNNHPFNVIYGAPGIGKTRILESIGDYTRKSSKLPTRQININISFGSKTPYKPNSIVESSARLSLCTRILFRYFVDGSNITSFDGFVNDLLESFIHEKITTELCFRCIRLWKQQEDQTFNDSLETPIAENDVILVNFGIDEFQRTLTSDSDLEMRRSKLKAIIREELATLHVSSFSSFFFNISLAGIHIGEISEIIHEESSHGYIPLSLQFLSSGALKSIINSLEPKFQTRDIMRALEFTGGWPRPLDIMIRHIKKESFNLNNKTSEILAQCKTSFQYDYGTINKNFYPSIIAYSICGVSNAEGTRLQSGDSSYTLEQLQSNGLLSLGPENVVKLPLYFIYNYIDYQPHNFYPNHVPTMYHHLKLALNIVQDGDYSFAQFEKLAGHYLVARMTAFHFIKTPYHSLNSKTLSPQPITLQELFGIDASYYPNRLRGTTFHVSNNTTYIEAPRHEPESTRSMDNFSLVLNAPGGLVDVSVRSSDLDTVQYLFNSMKFTNSNDTIKDRELYNCREVKLASILDIDQKKYVSVLHPNKCLTPTTMKKFLSSTGWEDETQTPMEDNMETDENQGQEEEEDIEQEKDQKEVRKRKQQKSEKLPNFTKGINHILINRQPNGLDHQYFTIFDQFL
ncbi:hypothetical protein PPL_03883 [Heterostelium album PN500]|uniref:Uncharacterized protein n=1 Tax=Heterostelium pallidum (strain ATCC 26659 / Pp 5 / PN500) TaxID=670386 RepID=D3B5E5_HETP5|nr:hypothetical protein PPL_03883 [Heterostelium album PN500]EFA83093.1 hypothetical protein PPL_03883 [Heterostelium album PN500]|eukprot:XP_020435210.1 hypothetical protein PPL_03883 [Heterostelium album PN500]